MKWAWNRWTLILSFFLFVNDICIAMKGLGKISEQGHTRASKQRSYEGKRSKERKRPALFTLKLGKRFMFNQTDIDFIWFFGQLWETCGRPGGERMDLFECCGTIVSGNFKLEAMLDVVVVCRELLSTDSSNTYWPLFSYFLFLSFFSFFFLSLTSPFFRSLFSPALSLPHPLSPSLPPPSISVKYSDQCIWVPSRLSSPIVIPLPSDTLLPNVCISV